MILKGFYSASQNDEMTKTKHDNDGYVLDELLPPKSDTQHNLRKRRHDPTLPEKKGHLAAKNIIIRLLYKDNY